MYTLKKQLDTTELIKWSFAVIGACIAFYLVSLKEIENDSARLSIERAKAKKEAVENVIQYRPRLRIHYTNMLTKDGGHLNVRVFLESKSTQEIYIRPPKLDLFDKDGKLIPNTEYTSKDIESFQGFISPKMPFNISYKIGLISKKAKAVDRIKLAYKVEADAVSAKAMSDYLKTFKDPEIDILASETTMKKFTYGEAIYKYGKNSIWSDFWINPR